MEKKPFIGQFSGFMFIGEEKAEFEGKTLISYYAKPYCTDQNTIVENCIEFKDDKLVIRDVHSPDGERYDCIWEQEDIESLLDKLGMVSAYRIEIISCDSIIQLLIPSDCRGIAEGAFDDCPNLKKLICLGEDLPVLNNTSVSIRCVQTYAEYEEAYQCHNGVHWINVPGSEQIVGCYINGSCEAIDRNDVEGLKWVFFWSRTVVIKDGAIDADAEIVGFSGSTAEMYADKHGNRFSSIDARYDETRLPEGIKIENGMLHAKGHVYLRLTGITDTQLAAIKPGTNLCLSCEPDEMNMMRVVFRNAETGEFCGLLANRAAYTAAYLMKRGYLEFSDAITENKGYVTATILWKEPITEPVRRLLRIMDLIKGQPSYFRILLECERDSGMKFVSALDVLNMSADEKKLTTDSIMTLVETDNCLSYAVAHRLSNNNFLSAFQYTANNRYAIPYSSFELIVDKKTSTLTCLSFGEPIELTATEESFAQIYINHYRQIYNLPPIQFKNVHGGGENGTV